MAVSLSQVSVRTAGGSDKSLGEYAGKVLLIVNVASRCGFTPQYEGLQALQDRYGDQGLSVLGFPCNDFGAQEPGTLDEIKTFCSDQVRRQLRVVRQGACHGQHHRALHHPQQRPSRPGMWPGTSRNSSSVATAP